MYCFNCGSIFKDDIVFCTKCGIKVKKNESNMKNVGTVLFRQNITNIFFPNYDCQNELSIWYKDNCIAYLNCDKFVKCEIPYGTYRFYIRSSFRKGYLDITITPQEPDLIVDIIKKRKSWSNKYMGKIYLLSYSCLNNYKRIGGSIYVSIQKNSNDWNELVQVKETEFITSDRFLKCGI